MRDRRWKMGEGGENGEGKERRAEGRCCQGRAAVRDAPTGKVNRGGRVATPSGCDAGCPGVAVAQGGKPPEWAGAGAVHARRAEPARQR